MATKLKIGIHEFEVIYSDEVEDCGYLDRDKNQIKISTKLSESQAKSTLIHEIFHAINNELDHALLDSLAEQWAQVLEENDLWVYQNTIQD